METFSAESMLHEILSKKAIGAARLGGTLLDLTARYGPPTAIQESRPCEQTWDFNEFQVWSDESGIIDRIFFRWEANPGVCSNVNLETDLSVCRKYLGNCTVETLERVVDSRLARITRAGKAIHFEARREGMEVFSVFVKRDTDKTHCFRLLRINTPELR